MTQAALTISRDDDQIREAAAERIRSLMRDWSRHTVEIGLELKAAKATFPIGPRKQLMGWRTWLKKEFKLTFGHAAKLIVAAEKFGHLHQRNKLLPSGKVLNFLSHKTTPRAAVKEVLRRAARGEKIGAQRAEQIAAKHAPSPKEANRQAKASGKPVLASDGYLYFGTSKEQAKHSENRRTVIYAVRRAIETLATIEHAPHEFLSLALPHQLWNREEEKQIGRAAKWLNALHVAWEARH
jgi:hypothetical protein